MRLSGVPVQIHRLAIIEALKRASNLMHPGTPDSHDSVASLSPISSSESINISKTLVSMSNTYSLQTSALVMASRLSKCFPDSLQSGLIL